MVTTNYDSARAATVNAFEPAKRPRAQTQAPSLNSGPQWQSGCGVGSRASQSDINAGDSLRAHVGALRQAYEVCRADGELPQLLTFQSGPAIDYTHIPEGESQPQFTRTVLAASKPAQAEQAAADSRLTYAVDRLLKHLGHQGATPRAEFVVERVNAALTRSSSNWFITAGDRRVAADALAQLKPAEFVWACDQLFAHGHTNELNAAADKSPVGVAVTAKKAELVQHLNISERLGQRLLDHLSQNLPVRHIRGY